METSSIPLLKNSIQVDTLTTTTHQSILQVIYYHPKYSYQKITTLEEAKNIWNTFARKEVLFENWDFINIFYSEFKDSVEFYVAYFGEKPVALIPLNFDKDTSRFESFFSKKCQHPIFILPGFESAFNFLIDKIPSPLMLEYMYFPYQETWTPKASSFQMGLYDLDVANYTSGEEYFAYINSLVPSKKRIKYNAEYRKIKELITNIYTNRVSDLEKLFEFNIASVTIDHYGEVSGFLSEDYKNGFRKLLNSPFFESTLFAFEIDGEIHDVELVLKYGNTLYHLTGATSKKIQNVGKFANISMIDFAIKEGCTLYNAGTGDYNWKEKLGLKMKPLYVYQKK